MELMIRSHLVCCITKLRPLLLLAGSLLLSALQSHAAPPAGYVLDWSDEFDEYCKVEIVYEVDSTWDKIIDNTVAITQPIFGRFKNITIAGGTCICYKDIIK